MKTWHKLVTSLLFSGLILMYGCVNHGQPGIGLPDIPNYHRVDARVDRGGLPTEYGYKMLKANNVMLVVDLTKGGETNPKESKWAVDNQIVYVHIPLSGIYAPSKADIDRILSILINTPGRVMVHCLRGKDRTGLIIACYRQKLYHMDPADSQVEADLYGMSPFELCMKWFIAHYER